VTGVQTCALPIFRLLERSNHVQAEFNLEWLSITINDTDILSCSAAQL
jgi:hypothetical protein